MPASVGSAFIIVPVQAQNVGLRAADCMLEHQPRTQRANHALRH